MSNIIKSIAYSVVTALVSVSLLSCKGDDDPLIVSGERTIICYMPAENTLADLVRNDISEMVEAAKYLGEKDRIVVYYDGTSNPQIYVIDKHTTALSINSLDPVFTYARDVNSCSKDVMTSVFRYIVSHYPAKSYGLIFNTHGLNWLPSISSIASESRPRKTFGVDNGINSPYSNSGDEMRIVDLASAIKTLPHLDFIFFDLCYMQSIEIAYEMRNCADYIIGSPAEIPGNGAPYEEIMPMLVADNIDYGAIIDKYATTYDGWELIPESGVALSVVRCDKLDSLQMVTSKLISKYGDEIKKCRYNETTDYLSYQLSGYRTGFFDMKEMMSRMITEADIRSLGIDKEENVADSLEWATMFSKAVPYSYVASKVYSVALNNSFVTTNPERCGGISMSLNPNETTLKRIIEEYESLEWRY
ncbi:MAG: hypothetical protein J5663_06570 [Bacteroidaceae bacterium]|nr:hypothetical protein [Bacteroidaceae bacterium]